MNYHLLNTRMRWSKLAQKRMLQKHVAFACNNAQPEINKIAQGDVVFLYQNRVGIIAYGIAHGPINTLSWEDGLDNASERNLKNFQQLKNPIPPADISAICKRLGKYEKGVFVRTRFSLPETVGKRLLEIAKAKPATK